MKNKPTSFYFMIVRNSYFFSMKELEKIITKNNTKLYALNFLILLK